MKKIERPCKICRSRECPKGKRVCEECRAAEKPQPKRKPVKEAE